MDIKKAKAGDKIYSVVSERDYINSDTTDYLAIEMDNYFYPVRKQDEAINSIPGVYDCGPFIRYIHPATEEQQEELSMGNIIDFNKDNIKDLIKSSNLLKEKEREILISPDNVTMVSIGEFDDPEMKALKRAIMDKHMDIDKYESRFGPNFNNDKRLLSKSRITISKLKSMCENLDIKATLILEDTSPDVPNPIGHKIEVELVKGETE